MVQIKQSKSNRPNNYVLYVITHKEGKNKCNCRIKKESKTTTMFLLYFKLKYLSYFIVHNTLLILALSFF